MVDDYDGPILVQSTEVSELSLLEETLDPESAVKIAEPMANYYNDEDDDCPVLLNRTQVPKSSLFEAALDTESESPAGGEGEVLKPPTAQSIDESGTELDESSSVEFDLDDDPEVLNRTGRFRRRSCRGIICLVVLLAVGTAGLVMGILFEYTGVFRSVNSAQSVAQDDTSVTPDPHTMPPLVIDDAPGLLPSEGDIFQATPPPTSQPTASSVLDDPLLKDLKSFSLGGLDDPSSPQFQAYQWLLNVDPLTNTDSDLARIQQRYALATLYFALQGEMPFYTERDECSWPSVQCDPISSIFSAENILAVSVEEIKWQVTHIRMAKHSLSGSIPAEVSLLASSLVHLDLAENPDLTGSIPDRLYELTNLKYLYLHENGMNGSLSESVGDLQLLEELFLGGNEFTGKIPYNLGSRRGIRPLRKYMICFYETSCFLFLAYTFF